VAEHIANHESPRTTKLYHRRQDEISLDEVIVPPRLLEQILGIFKEE
jgi:hypothetical protein